jgi:tellurite resistance protein/uncharacterized Zn finger protein (UPF0148 family)
MKNRIYLQRLITVSLLFLLVITAFARVGGGGGDSSSGDGDSGAILDLLLLLIYIPFPYNIIIVAVILLIAWFARKKYKESSDLNTLSKIDQGFESDIVINERLNTIPGFDKAEFLKKVDFAFLEVQKAWASKNMNKVRRFMSDGVYQRFHVQQLMMSKLSQTNEITHLHLKKVKIAFVEKEGITDILHVQYEAEIADNFISDKFPKLNQKYKESFVEFWTYVRRRSDTPKDIFYSQACPNCMAPLPEDMGESAKCPACSTFTNLGEYDWVLSEITQPEEFIDLYNNRSNRDYLKASVATKLADVHGASVQILEDRASNAYLQLRVAHALKDFTRIRRFSHDNFYAKMEQQKYDPYLFNRLYLRDVSMINLLEDDERFYAVFSMGCREQKVNITPDNQLQILESTMVTRNDNIVLCLRKDHEMGGFPVLAHNCSNCGAGVMDSTNVKCSFCENVLNSDKKDWILYDMLNSEQYAIFRSKFDMAALSAKKEAKLDGGDDDIRDYVLNNTMVIMMADGVLEQAEKEYMESLSKKLGYNADKVSALWEYSSVNSLALNMPEDKGKQQKVYNKMVKAAKADGTIQDSERAILDEIRDRYSLSEN